MRAISGRLTCVCAATAALVWMAPLSASETAARKPNLIVILADDLGYADVGFHGGQEIPTPHLDALAQGGVRCTDGYVTHPWCSPTRAGLITGRYPQRFGFSDVPFTGKSALPTSETTLAELLRSAGYATGIIGKWHLGQEAQSHPQRHGFEEFFGFLGGADYYLPVDEHTQLHPLVRDTPILRGQTPVKDPAYLTDAFADEAVRFIERHKQQPFFLYLPFNAVHVPLQATEKYLDRFPDIPHQARRTYAAMLSAMDDAVGRVSQKLAKERLERETLIFFLSDNGGHPLANAAHNDPLRGEKSSLFEGGIRVPFVVKWTNELPAGSTYAQPVSSLDILPTAVAAAQVALPSRLHLDGVNLLPYLAGQNHQPPHEALYWRMGRNRAIRQGKWKLVMPSNQPAALFDLAADIGETKDLSATHPQIVARLQELYSRWIAQLR